MERSLIELAVSFYLADQMYNSHKQDVVAIETHNRAEKAKSKSKSKG